MAGTADEVAVASQPIAEVDGHGLGQLTGDSGCDSPAEAPADRADLLAAIRKQVEFYFSDTNLPTDKHLLKQISKGPEGYVSLRMIANFKRVKQLTKDLSVVTEALQPSTVVTLDEAQSCIKRTAPLPAFDVTDITRRTVVVEHLPDKPTIDLVTQLLSQYGNVAVVRICNRNNINKLPNWLAKAAESINVTMAAGEFALVEFSSEDDCVTCVNKTRNPDNWRTSLRVRHLLPNFKPSGTKGGPKHDKHHGSQHHNHQQQGKQQHQQQHGRDSHSGHEGGRPQSRNAGSRRSSVDGGRRSFDASSQQQQHNRHTNAAASTVQDTAAHQSASSSAAGGSADPGSPNINGSKQQQFDVLGSPVGLAHIKAPTGSSSGSGVGGAIGSPRTVKSPAPPAVASLIDSILSAPTSGSLSRSNSGINDARWSSAGATSGVISSSSNPAAAVAAALAGVSTPPQPGSPRQGVTSTTSGFKPVQSGDGSFASPSRFSAPQAPPAFPAPVQQSALAAQLAAAAAAAAQAAMSGSPHAGQGSNTANWRNSSSGAAAAAGVSVSAPNTPLAGNSILSAGDAVAAALDELDSPTKADGLLASGLSGMPVVDSSDAGTGVKPGRWIPASRLRHMQQAAWGAFEPHSPSMATSGSEAEDNPGSWRAGGWGGQAGSLGTSPASKMKPPRPRSSSSGGAKGSSNRQRRSSWHAVGAGFADSSGAGATAATAAGLGGTSTDSDSGSGGKGRGSSSSKASNRRASRLGQTSADYQYQMKIEAIKEASCELDPAAAARALAALSVDAGPASPLGATKASSKGSKKQGASRSRMGSETGSAAAAADSDVEDGHDEGEGGIAGKRRRRRHRSSNTGSRRKSLDEPAAAGGSGGSAGSRRQSLDEGVGKGGGSRSSKASADGGHYSSSNSGADRNVGRSPEPGAKHHEQQERRNSHGGSAADSSKDHKKKEKKDYAAWAAATPQFRAEASAARNNGGGASSSNASPLRGSSAGVSPMRASNGGAHSHEGEGHARIARGPDGTRGFISMGRGRPVTPPAPAP